MPGALSMTAIAVVIPVGPFPHHLRWAGDAVESVLAQSRPPDKIVVVDDMAGPALTEMLHEIAREAFGQSKIVQWLPPWRLGVTAAFNCGVGIAFNRDGGSCDLALMMGADDVLQPNVLRRLEATYEANGRRDGYYYCEVEYQDGGIQGLACNNAAVTPGLWRQTGGLPSEAGAGGMDAALISALMVHHPEWLVKVDGDKTSRFWSRQHPDQESARLGAYFTPSGMIRDIFTQQYRDQPPWGR